MLASALEGVFCRPMSAGSDPRRPLHTLVLEDEEADALLLIAELKHHGFQLADVRTVSDREGFLQHCVPELDLILADFALPEFDAFRALQIRNERAPDVPFIIVSGRITETQAIDLMRHGAADYLMKDRLRRLPAAVESALRMRELEAQAVEDRDGLTNLSRAGPFLRHVEQVMGSVSPLERRAHEDGSGAPLPAPSTALLAIDIDRFQTINASLGYAIGDAVLQEVARRLERACSDPRHLARLGSDEFAVLMEGVSEAQEILDFAERLQHRLAAPVRVKDEELYISVAIGIAMDDGSYLSAEAMLRDAETAMVRAKSQGRAQHEFFQDEMRRRALAQLRTETELRHALDQREFRLRYQPVLSLAEQRVVGFEALLRWEHPRRGLLSPAEIIPVAEENGLIYPIGAWVLEDALRTYRTWCEQNPALRETYVTVNVSACQFRRTDLLEHVSRILEANKLPGSSLCIELTETALMQSDERAVTSTFAALREMGVRLLLDDFGTGYSSLSYLSRFQVDGIKIDRSFVSGATGQRLNRAIVLMILGLAERLELPVIAEGVETDEQRRILNAMGCKLGQGYFFSRAMPGDDVPAWAQACNDRA